MEVILEGMRKASQGWIGRLLMGVVMGVISLSFAVWGIGDIFRNFSAAVVAKVGSTDISADTFRQAYQNQLQTVQRQARRAVTSDEARALGLDAQVLERLVAEAALDQRVRSLGLALSDDAIVKATTADPTFADAGGQFDPQRFASILRDSGFSEASFMREQRAVYLRQDLADAVAGEIMTPVAALDAMNRYVAETRSIDYVELPASAAGDIAAPGEETLRAYYTARAQSFQAPDYRTITALALDPAAMTDPAAVSDADATKLYDEVKGVRYGTPEKRALEQIVFPDEAAAAAARVKIEAGATFAAVAADAKLDVADLGTLTRGDVIEKSIADAAFALSSGGVSQPVKTQFGAALVHVVKVDAAEVRPFADVAGDLKKEIALERARNKVAALHDKIEDDRTSGKTLSEAAKAEGLDAPTFPPIDQNGQDKAGAPVALPDRDALLKAAFASDVGVDNDTLTTPGGGYVWFEIGNVERAHGRSFDEVKAEVEREWRADELARKLSAAGDALAAKINAGESVDDAAKQAGGLAVKHAADVKRIGASSVPPGVAARVFALPVGRAGSAAGEAGDTRLVFKVLAAETPPFDANSDAAKRLNDGLKSALKEDVLEQYVGQLKADMGVTVNAGALKAAVGASNAY